MDLEIEAMTSIHEALNKLGGPARERVHGWLIEKLAAPATSSEPVQINVESAPARRVQRGRRGGKKVVAAESARAPKAKKNRIDRDNLLLLLRTQKEPFTAKAIMSTLQEKGYLADRVPQTIYEWTNIGGLLEKVGQIENGKGRAQGTYQLTKKGEERAASLGN